MILCDIADAKRFEMLGEEMADALQWLLAHHKDEFEKGSFTIGRNNDIVVKCEEPHLLPREKAALEAHRKFIDIHVPLKDVETMGWASLTNLKYPHGEYDEERDIIFYGDSATSFLHVRVGQIAVFFPEDAHAPNLGTGKNRKLCIKIPVKN